MVAALILAACLPSTAAESRWPRTIESPEGKFVVYQPQLESFTGDRVRARAAISVTPAGSKEPIFGAMWVSARVDTDRAERTVNLHDAAVTSVKFPDAAQAQQEKFKKAVEESGKTWDLSLSLDQFLAAVQLAEKEKEAAEKFNNAPPKFLLRKTPAVLVSMEGEPKLRKVEKTGLMRVVNTPFLIVLDAETKAYYLRAGENWMQAEQAAGPWKITGRVPSAAVALATGKDPSGLTGLSPVLEPADDEVVPSVIVATEPSELIVLDGEPEFETIPGTNLLYVSNTQSDVFMDISSQSIYILVSGRWFHAKSKAGPWAYVPADDLPKDFALIPPGSPKADVRASVPNTNESREAVADAYLPQTATVNRKTAKLTVAYDGDPKFEAIEGTTMAYAVNTSSAVIMLAKRYYCCDQAVWFEADAPLGPWVVCVSVPKEVYTIPPSCPIYQVKYVYVYESTPETVYVGYTPGYEGCYVYGASVVFGTGYVYPPWNGPHWYPRPTTWGFSVHYNSSTGNWWAVGWAKGPNGWVIHGGGGHYPVVWNGPNPPPPPHGGSYYHGRGDVNPPPQRPVRPGGDVTRPGQGGGGVQNNLFTDRDGSVYRKGLDGWEKPSGSGSGGRTDQPPASRLNDQQRQDLDNQLRARSRGDERSRQFSQPSSSRPMARPAGRMGGRGR